MEDAPSYEELAQELIGELTALGRTLTPMVINSTRGETAVLMTLFRAEGPLTPGALGDAAHVSSARVANILRSLEEKGLVTRRHSSGDRRQVEVHLTDDGRAAASATRERRSRTVASYLRALGQEDATELVRIVRRSRDILDERAARGGDGA